MPEESVYKSITPTTLLQFNATVMVGIFLFLTLGATGFPATLILTTMFPFVVSAALILVYETRKYVGKYDGKDNQKLIASTFRYSKGLSAAGMFYAIAILLVIIFYYPDVLKN